MLHLEPHRDYSETTDMALQNIWYAIGIQGINLLSGIAFVRFWPEIMLQEQLLQEQLLQEQLLPEHE